MVLFGSFVSHIYEVNVVLQPIVVQSVDHLGVAVVHLIECVHCLHELIVPYLLHKLLVNCVNYLQICFGLVLV